MLQQALTYSQGNVTLHSNAIVLVIMALLLVECQHPI